MSFDPATIIGYCLFGVSEILALLPVPTNGFLQSIFMGCRSSFSNPNTDIEMARTFVNKKPQMANVVQQLATNSHVSDTMKNLVDNPHILPHIDCIASNPQIQYILTLLKQHPEVVGDVVSAVEGKISQTQTQIPQM